MADARRGLFNTVVVWRFDRFARSLKQLVLAVYRSWVSELIDHDANAADQLLRDAITDSETTAQFRDDTLTILPKKQIRVQYLFAT